MLAAMLLGFAISVSRLNQSRHREGLSQLEHTVRQAAVACYASEGFYPPDIAYLQEHYGLRYDETEYTVHYGIFASNLMPDITVLEK